MSEILVTGGAGYIGTHVIRALELSGHDVIVFDNFCRGHRRAVINYRTITANMEDKDSLLAVMKKYEIKAVMHFAAYSDVKESVDNPILYYKNNVIGGLNLLEAMQETGVRYIILSSSAAVYGEPKTIPVREDHPLKPTSPYGESKALLEKAMYWFNSAYGLEYVSLRYFNAAGASDCGTIGEDHEPETHLIPLILQVALGQRKYVTVFGNDYPTKDGTAVRDYIHVNDLAEAHVLALKALIEARADRVYNLGNGSGYSVMEVIKASEKICGVKIPFEIGPRRSGDPAILVASSGKAEKELGWEQKQSNLEEIITSAWKWHRENPVGYKSCD